MHLLSARDLLLQLVRGRARLLDDLLVSVEHGTPDAEMRSNRPHESQSAADEQAKDRPGVPGILVVSKRASLSQFPTPSQSPATAPILPPSNGM